MNVDAVADVLWQRLEQQKPRALLIGAPPFNYHKYNYVNEKPYDAIVLGVLPPGQLLQMPDNAVCEALLQGKPVWLWHCQSHHGASSAKALRQALDQAEQRLLRFGVQKIGRDAQLITAERARELRKCGQKPAAGSRITPLAKDILEGKAT